MRQRGLVKGGTEGCAIIGHGDRWREPDKVRFFDDEPVRHKMLDLIVSLHCLPLQASVCGTHHVSYLSCCMFCCMSNEVAFYRRGALNSCRALLFCCSHMC